VLPLGQSRHDDLLEVGHHSVERFGLGGRMLGQLRPNITGLGRRKDALLGHTVFEELGDPIDHVVAVLTELFRRHGCTVRLRLDSGCLGAT
jgi:hypothetical protein